MKKRFLLITFLIVIIVALVCLCGCNANSLKDMTGKTAVVYELEGGKYQNCKGTITHYYDVEDEDNILIYSPETLSGAVCEREGYTFDGWYKTKTVSGEHVVYSNEWDFSTDKISKDGVKLYAKWAPLVKYTYAVCYYDETTGERKLINSYEVQKGEKFEDYLHYIDNGRKGAYTAIAVLDSEGNPWDYDFTHPGGETSTAIDVVVEFIKGRFKVCSTGEELVALLGKNKNENIYLTADVDCGGMSLDIVDYMGEFIGNGHTVSNFTVKYVAGKDGLDNDNLLNASIFGNAYKAKISDVTFDNVSLNYVSGFTGSQGIVIGVLGSRVEEVTITNVKVTNMTITISEIPSNLINNGEGDVLDTLIIVTNELCAEVGSGCVFNGDCSVENIIFVNKVEKN